MMDLWEAARIDVCASFCSSITFRSDFMRSASTLICAFAVAGRSCVDVFGAITAGRSAAFAVSARTLVATMRADLHSFGLRRHGAVSMT